MTSERDTNSPRSDSFVARLWLEDAPGRKPVWRGHVRHVQGSEEKYFKSLVEMQVFVEEVSGIAVPTVTDLVLGNSSGPGQKEPESKNPENDGN